MDTQEEEEVPSLGVSSWAVPAKLQVHLLCPAPDTGLSHMIHSIITLPCLAVRAAGHRLGHWYLHADWVRVGWQAFQGGCARLSSPGLQQALMQPLPSFPSATGVPGELSLRGNFPGRPLRGGRQKQMNK